MNLGAQMGPLSITKLSPNWACQMGPIHCPKFLLSGRQALDQHVVVDGIKRCRKMKEAEKRMISSINRLNEVGDDLEKRSLCRMELAIGRLIGRWTWWRIG